MPRNLAATLLAAFALAVVPTATAATMDGQMLAQDDHNAVHAAQYDVLLNRLQPKCRQGRKGIARLTWSAKRVLNYRYSNLTLLVALWSSIPKGHAPMNCAGQYASM